MKFWRAAGSKLYPTAETQECHKAVTDALTAHIQSSLCFKEDLADWERQLKTRNKEAWEKQKPVEPTARALKILIGKEILGRFPLMSQRRHMYKNLLQVTTSLSLSSL